jgi:hypothetical protein
MRPKPFLMVVLIGMLLVSACQGINTPATLPTATATFNMSEQEISLSEEALLRMRSWSDQLHDGWIHVVIHQKTNSNTSDEMPDDFLTEDWVLLDEYGNQLKGIYLQRYPDYRIIQVSILKYGNWHNLTYDDTTAAPGQIPYTLDFGFPDIVNLLKDKVTKTQVKINDESLDKFSVVETYAKPLSVTGFEKQIVSLGTEAFINMDGMVRLYQTMFTFDDGTSEISSYAEVQVFERDIEPPAEILAYLEKQ